MRSNSSGSRWGVTGAVAIKFLLLNGETRGGRNLLAGGANWGETEICLRNRDDLHCLRRCCLYCDRSAPILIPAQENRILPCARRDGLPREEHIVPRRDPRKRELPLRIARR